jgi:predicted nucleic acid-binding Zn ribbon protein
MSLRRKEQTSSSAIKNLIRGLGLEEKLVTAQIEETWKKMMGSPISQHTQRIFIDDQTLFIQMDSAVLRYELNFNQNKIFSELNKEINQNFFDKIKFI